MPRRSAAARASTSAAKGRHHGVGVDQVVAQDARDPLVAHVGAVCLARQGGGQVHQVGAAYLQHGGDQQSEVATLRLALPRQKTLKLAHQPVRDCPDPAHDFNHLSHQREALNHRWRPAVNDQGSN